MSTFVGPESETDCEIDPKIFSDPGVDCTREGVWTRGMKCSSMFNPFHSSFINISLCV